MTDKILKPVGEEIIDYQGKMHEIFLQKMSNGEKEMVFEYARRSPGTRLIIIKDGKLLITKEYRYNTESWDYRLPGGKVFDSLDEYNKFLKSGADIVEISKKAASKEALEEAGVIVKNIKHHTTSKAGATIVWDLFYFLVEDFDVSQKKLGIGEDIEVSWMSFEEVKQLCISGKIQEDRTVGILLKFLLKESA